MTQHVPLLSVVICTRNRPHLLSMALESLGRQTARRDEFETIVVDNGPSASTRLVCQSQPGGLKPRCLIEHKTGLSHARNAGYGAARGQYVAYLDDDAKAAPDWVERILDVIRHSAPEIFGGPYLPFYLSEKPSWFRDEYGSSNMGDSPLELRRPLLLTGSNVVIRKVLLERLGGFDPRYGMAGDRMAYAEETEFQMRALREVEGLSIRYFPRLVVHHLVPPAKMNLRRFIRSRWAQGKAHARLQASEGMQHRLPTLLRYLGANAALFIAESVRGLWRDGREYPFYQNYFVERVLPALGGMSVAVENVRMVLGGGRRTIPPRREEAPAEDRAASEMEMPAACEAGLVSVIIPTYNRAPLIAETLDSVQGETYRPIEVLVVDDGSTDNTRQVVQGWKDRFAGEARLRVRYLRQENSGAPAARNRGLVESHGEFIQFLDSYDLLHPGKLSAQVRAMREEPQVQYVFSRWEEFSETGQPPRHRWSPRFSPDRDDLLDLMAGKDMGQNLPLWTANGLYRRALCRRIGPWDISQRRLQDRLYNLRLLALDVPYRYLPRVHVRARIHCGGRIEDTFADPEALENMRATWGKVQMLLQRSGLLNRRRKRFLARMYYGLARPAFIAEDTELGMELLRAGLAVCPPSGTRLKLLVTRSLYAVLGTARANRLFALRMRLAGMFASPGETGG